MKISGIKEHINFGMAIRTKGLDNLPFDTRSALKHAVQISKSDTKFLNVDILVKCKNDKPEKVVVNVKSNSLERLKQIPQIYKQDLKRNRSKISACLEVFGEAMRIFSDLFIRSSETVKFDNLNWQKSGVYGMDRLKQAKLLHKFSETIDSAIHKFYVQ